jgi:hypothetical protein
MSLQAWIEAEDERAPMPPVFQNMRARRLARIWQTAHFLENCARQSANASPRTGHQHNAMQSQGYVQGALGATAGDHGRMQGVFWGFK